MNIEFEWDSGNLKKMDLIRKSGREFTIQELESVFYDDSAITEKTTFDFITGEQRYIIYGKSNQNSVICVMFVVRNHKIRIFNFWKAKGSKLKKYNEKIRRMEN